MIVTQKIKMNESCENCNKQADVHNHGIYGLEKIHEWGIIALFLSYEKSRKF